LYTADQNQQKSTSKILILAECTSDCAECAKDTGKCSRCISTYYITSDDKCKSKYVLKFTHWVEFSQINKED
jgi:hypothetical protein